MTGTLGDDLIAGKEFQQVFIEVGKCVFCKERRIPYRNDGTVYQVIMEEINIENPGHLNGVELAGYS